jgi:hypothetical protein
MCSGGAQSYRLLGGNLADNLSAVAAVIAFLTG